MTGEMKPLPAHQALQASFLGAAEANNFLLSSPQPMLETGHTPHVPLF